MSISLIQGGGGSDLGYLSQSVNIANRTSRATLESMGTEGCKTCASRTYRDGSDDPTVSYQTATHISPEAATGAVLAHENEHVRHEQAKATKEDRQVVSQTVTLQMSCCPECGRPYVSGGKTVTITAPADDSAESTDPERILDLFA
jgi:hypothetical protein